MPLSRAIFILILALAVPVGLTPGGPPQLVPSALADDGDGGDGDGDGGDNGGDNGGGGGGGGGSGGGAGGAAGGGGGGRGERTGEISGEVEDDITEVVEEVIDLISDVFGGGGGRGEFLQAEIVALGVPGLQPQERAALTAAGFRVISEDSLVTLGATVTRLALPTGLDAEDALDVARPLAPNVIFDLNHLYQAGGMDCTSASCWGWQATRMASLASNACQRGAPIAMIDTPIASDHPALRRADIEVRSFLPSDAVPAASDHGTAIAALLVGESLPGVAPLAPGARLLAAETFRDLGGESQADAVAILRGIDWALSQNARVIAMSIQGPPNSALALGVRASARRANLVAAAGNAGPNGDAAYPAAYPEVMAVSAVDGRLRPYRKGTRGDYVEIAAPGVDVPSAGPDGVTTTWTGSSFAVPFVVGAMLRARAETQGNPIEARALLARMARDLGAPGRDEIYGHGLLQSPGDRCW